MRKIPATMVSQHPDHAGKPYWHNQEFISTSNETQECFLSFSDLGVSEYKWDWEGKFVDESVTERLFGEHYDYFHKNPLGSDKFLTFRLPNPKVETEFRLGRAFMGIIGAAGLAKKIGLHSPPLFEVILPMTESELEMIEIQEAFSEIASLKHRLYSEKNGHLKHIAVIPLFEQVQTITNAAAILKKYIKVHVGKFGEKPTYLRPYIARSDPALNSGVIPTVLAIKIALSRFKNFGDIPLFPIIGTGSLPFRGGLSPERIDDFLNEYEGVSTALLQSAFRYDFDKELVRKAITRLETELPRRSFTGSINLREEKEIINVIKIFERYYKSSIEKIADFINIIAPHLPKRRERVQHVGLFGYSRGVGKVKLPRAITFTGSLYSTGIPPELIGAGRGLKEILRTGKLKILEKYYVNLKKDLILAGYYLNKDTLRILSRKNTAWKEILEEIDLIEKYLGCELGPKSKDHLSHKKLTSEIFKVVLKGGKPEEEIRLAAVLRKSLG